MPTGTGTISLTKVSPTKTTDFDGLSNTAGSTTNTTLPTGWYITETGGGARDNEQYAVDDGGSNTGDIYSYGSAPGGVQSTERALGQERSGTLIPVIGAFFTNDTGETITSLDISYDGEQWRFGAAHTTVAERMDFQYSLNATDLTTGTWVDVNALDFNPPVVSGGTGKLDGNLAANRVAGIASTISSLSIAPGATFWIRWNDVDATGAEDGLAIDNFSITPHTLAAATPTLTIADVIQAETNSGTTTFTFTVTLNAAAPTGGVTFDIATADGTATTAGGDYVARSLTGQTIAAGLTTYTFDVTVNGDAAIEANESFFVNVTNVTGATVGDGQAQGTITNDDTPILTIADVSQAEPDAGTVTYTFTVSLDRPAPVGGVTFDIATADGTATTADSDYVGKTLTSQTIAAGLTTYTFDVTVNGDIAVEPNESFVVNVTNVVNATVGDGQAQGTLTNTDVPAVPVATVADASIVEGQSGVSYLVFTVGLSFAPTGPVTLDYATSNGTATAGSDYLAVSGQLSFAAGETSKTVSVPIIGDANAELNETLNLTLSNPTGATIGDGAAVGTITNDDYPAYFPLASAAFGENWTDTSRISVNDDWSKVGSIIGYLGDIDAAGAVTGVDPRTLTGANLGAVDVIANQNTAGSTSGGVGEFQLTDPTIGLQGSGTADAPSIVLFLDSRGQTGIHLTATLRDIDGSADDAAQQVNVQYRTDPNGTWTNVPGGYFADVTTAGSATQTTALDVVLPAGANNSPTLQIRIMTTNAAGSDEWVGIDDIVVSGTSGPASYSIAEAAAVEGTGGTTPIAFTVSRAGDSSAAGTVDYAVTFPGGGFSADAADFASALTGSVAFNAGEASKTLTLNLAADSNPEADEGFTVTLSNPSAGGTLGDTSATGTIVNDDGSPPFVTIADVTQAEGNSGGTIFTFTVTRTGGTGAFTVDYSTANGTATLADGDYVAKTGTLSFAAGENSKTIDVTVNGDGVGELNETFAVNLSNPTGFAVIADPSATGTITNDDVIPVYMVQGSGHTSPFVGQALRTGGIVTAIDSNGYYIQDPNGDGNTATSDGLFVFTGTAPTGVAIGDRVEVNGTVTEFVAGAGALSVTELTAAAGAPSVISTGNPLPAAVVIGTGGTLPPTGNGPGNTFGNALAFYESMEGMRVVVKAPSVVQDTNSFGETWVLASGGAGATGVNMRGGITISAGDLNPERIQIDNDANLSPGYNPAHTAGDILGDVTGIMNYANTSYEVLVTGTVVTTTDVTLPKETTTLAGDSGHLAVASYNVENLDIGDGQGKFDILAGNIVFNLAAPDIIALQEVQDADGPGNGADLSGTVTAQKLIDAIKAAGGPDYLYIEIAPTTAGSTGGEPGGNIRNGYLYNPARVGYVSGSAALITDSAFSGSRKPLVASFTFNGETVTLIDVHFTSRLGSDELEGSIQPPTDAGDGSRTAQGQAVRNYINSALATDPALKIGVAGDFNGFYFEGGVGALEAGGVMTDLHRLNPAEERYSYVFDGNSQAIDHMVVTGNMLPGAQFDVVHLNSEYSANANRPTDHDPIVARFAIAAPNQPAVAQDDAVSTPENAVKTGSVFADNGSGPDSDPDGPPLAVGAVNNVPTDVGKQITLPSGALLTLNEDGSYSYDPNGKWNYEVSSATAAATGAKDDGATDSFTYTLVGGNTATVVVNVTGVDGPGDQLRGNSEDNVINGTPGNDLFVLNQGGNDHAFGNGGNDAIYFGNTFTADDSADGGAGTDVLILQGNYDLVMDADSMTGIEALSLQSGASTRWGDTANNFYDYSITLDDANLGDGEKLIVNASNLRADEDFTFDASAEQDGFFLVYAGGGHNDLTGGAEGDIFHFEGNWKDGDVVDGGGGRDVVILTGPNGVNHFDIGAGALTNVEAISVSERYATNPAAKPSYDLVIADGNVIAGGDLIVNGSSLTDPTQTFSVDAHLVTGNLRLFAGAGQDVLQAGSGNDTLYGGESGDTLYGGAGNDVFQYRAVTESDANQRDGIQDFRAGDVIDLSYIDADTNQAGNQAFHFIGAAGFGGHGPQDAGELRYSNVAGNIWLVAGDTDGDGASNFEVLVILPDPHTFTANDFML